MVSAQNIGQHREFLNGISFGVRETVEKKVLQVGQQSKFEKA
jgi:hypothetical protein